MTDKEKIITEIERLMKWKPKAIPSGMCQRDVLNIRKGVLLVLKDFINSLPAEQPSEALEEVATVLTNEMVGELNLGDYTDHSRHNTHWHSFREGVIAGANWQKERIINKACKWLGTNIGRYTSVIASGIVHISFNSVLSEFRKAMEDEQ